MSATPSSPAPDTPSPDFNLSDKATWAMILTVIAGLIGTIHPGFQLAPFVPAASALVTGLAPLLTLLAKHQYAKVAETAVAKAAQSQSLLPADVQMRISSLEDFAYNLTQTLHFTPPPTPSPSA